MIVVAAQSIPVTAAKRGKGRPSHVPTGKTLDASVHSHHDVEITASTSTCKSKKKCRKQPNVEKVAAVFNMSPLKMLSATTAATTSAAAPDAAIDARAVTVPNAVTIAAAPNAAAQAAAAPNTAIQAVAAAAVATAAYSTPPH